jgi:selenocysteine lyase/cysteine desulfurase
VLHLNNAGSSLQPAPVLDTVLDYIRLEGEIGGYEAAARHRDYLEGIYETIARLVGCSAEDIALFQSATLAWDTAFYGMRLGRGDRILTTTSEYASNFIAYLHQQRQSGIVIDVVPDTPEGDIDVAALAGRIDGDVKLISINHMPTQKGLINPAAAVGAVAKQAGVPFLLDACQTVGQLPIDVEKIGCDFLSATSRKYLRGPRGLGFL